MALVWRVMAALSAVNALVLAVFVGLASLQFGSILAGLIDDRLEVLARTLGGPFESVAALGLPLETVRNADAILELVRQSDDEIAAVHVYGPDGRIVHSTRADPPETFAGLPLLPIDAGVSPTARFDTPESFVLARGIPAIEGGLAGGVVIEYSRDGARTQVLAMAARLALIALGILVTTTLLGIGVLRVALSEHLKVFGAILAAFDRFERRFWRRRQGAGEDQPRVRGFGIDSHEFARLLDRSEQEYEAARQGVQAAAGQGGPS